MFTVFFHLKISSCISCTAQEALGIQGHKGMTLQLSKPLQGSSKIQKYLSTYVPCNLTASASKLTSSFLKHLLDAVNIMTFLTEHLCALRGSYQAYKKSCFKSEHSTT